MHTLFIGILMGWGAAIPVGPVNLEVARRNLSQSTQIGIIFGLGACSADLIYLVLLCVGAVYLLQHPVILNTVGLIGSVILLWFAWMAFHARAKDSSSLKTSNPIAAYRDGLIMTFFNPYTILFWASISSQVTMLTGNKQASLLMAGIGLIIGTVSWVLSLNLVLHVNRKRLPEKVDHYLNITGGFILLGFGLIGMVKSVWGLLNLS